MVRFIFAIDSLAIGLYPKTHLTAVEYETLSSLMVGFTMLQTGKILNVNRTTIRRRRNSIRKKYLLATFLNNSKTLARPYKVGLKSFVAFCSVVCFAQHLTISNYSCSTFAPRRYMVSIHFGIFPYLIFICIVSYRTQWTI